MKRVVLANVLVMAIVATEGAATAGDVTAGVKGGGVFASLATAGQGAFDTASDGGVAVGAFASVEIGHGVRFQPEVLFGVRRFSAIDAAAPFGVSSRGIEIPLLIQYRAPSSRRVRALFSAGPQLSVITKVTQSLGPADSDISDQIKDVDVGATFGGGVAIGAGRGSVTIEARGNVGLRNVSEAVPSMKARAFLMLAGYEF